MGQCSPGVLSAGHSSPINTAQDKPSSAGMPGPIGACSAGRRLTPMCWPQRHKYALGPAPHALLSDTTGTHVIAYKTMSEHYPVALFQKKFHTKQFDNCYFFLQAEISSNWENLVLLSDFFFPSVSLYSKAHSFITD